MLEALLKMLLWRRMRKHKQIAIANFELAKKLHKTGKRHWLLYKQHEQRWGLETRRTKSPNRTHQPTTLRGSDRRQEKRGSSFVDRKEPMPNGVDSPRK